jgi:hypothetical protein
MEVVMRVARWATFGVWAVLAGCQAGTGDVAGGGSGGTSGSLAGGTAAQGTASTGAFMTSATSSGTGAMQIAEVFGHSASVLYKLDPDTKFVSAVGNFSNCGAEVIDIALDKDSNLFATSYAGLYKVDRTTAACTLIQSGNYPNSLSFVPAGTLDMNVEALVGYEGDEYVRIDPASGNITPIGNLSGNGLVSSGDVVSVKGGASYLTVTGVTCADCLVEIDPASGAMVKNWGSLGYESVYGIAFWAGSVYGFDAAGELFEVKFDNGVMTTALINSPPNVSFWGAGSTTSAPPIPVPN